MKTLTEFLHMGGYARYVWPAYASVLTVMLLQWLLPWRRWHRYVNTTRLTTRHDNNKYSNVETE